MEGASYKDIVFQLLFAVCVQAMVSIPRCSKGMAIENPYLSETMRISSMFTKWKCREKRIEYLQTFSISKWKQLPTSTKAHHTLSNCKECTIYHTTLQITFPGKKLEPSKDVATAVGTVTNRTEEMHATREIFADLQPLFENRYGCSLTDAVTRLPGSRLQAKPTSVDKKRVKRKIQRV